MSETLLPLTQRKIAFFNPAVLAVLKGRLFPKMEETTSLYARRPQGYPNISDYLHGTKGDPLSR